MKEFAPAPESAEPLVSHQDATEFLATKGTLDMLVLQAQAMDWMDLSAEARGRMAVAIAPLEPETSYSFVAKLPLEDRLETIQALAVYRPDLAIRAVEESLAKIMPQTVAAKLLKAMESLIPQNLEVALEVAAQVPIHDVLSVQTQFLDILRDHEAAREVLEPMLQQAYDAQRTRIKDEIGVYGSSAAGTLTAGRQELFEFVASSAEFIESYTQVLGPSISREHCMHLGMNAATLKPEAAAGLFKNAFAVTQSRDYDIDWGELKTELIEWARQNPTYATPLLAEVDAQATAVEALLASIAGQPDLFELGLEKIKEYQENRYKFASYDSVNQTNMFVTMLLESDPQHYERLREEFASADIHQDLYRRRLELYPEGGDELLPDPARAEELSVYALIDPEYVARIYDGLADDPDRPKNMEQVAGALALAYAQKDPERALRYADASKRRNSFGRYPQALEAYKIIAQDLVSTDPDRAIQIILEHFDPTELYRFVDVMPEVQSTIVTYLTKETRQAMAHVNMLREIMARSPELQDDILTIAVKMDKYFEDKYKYDRSSDERSQRAQLDELFKELQVNLVVEDPFEMLNSDCFKLYHYAQKNATDIVERLYARDPERATAAITSIQSSQRTEFMVRAAKYDSSLFDPALEQSIGTLHENGRPFALLMQQLAEEGRFEEVIGHIQAVQPERFSRNRRAIQGNLCESLPQYLQDTYPELQDTLVNLLIADLEDDNGHSFRSPENLVHYINGNDRARTVFENFVINGNIERRGIVRELSYHTGNTMLQHAFPVNPSAVGSLYTAMVHNLDRRGNILDAQIKNCTAQQMKDFLEGVSQQAYDWHHHDRRTDIITRAYTLRPDFAPLLLEELDKVPATTLSGGAPISEEQQESMRFGDYVKLVRKAGPSAEAHARIRALYMKLGPRLKQKPPIDILVEAFADDETMAQRGEQQAGLYGEKNALLNSFDRERDRSINFNAFTAEDIANNTLLIDQLIAQATNPVELNALFAHLERLAEHDPELELEYASKAISALNSLKQAKRIHDSYRAQVADQGRRVDAPEVYHHLYRELPRLRQLGTKSASLVPKAQERGYHLRHYVEYPWLLENDVLKTNAQPFPADGLGKEQYAWLADNAFVKLQGFNKGSIGQIIHHRLAMGLEGTLHDATQWMSALGITEKDEGYKNIFNAETGRMERQQVTDEMGELALLQYLMRTNELSEDVLRRLPGYEQADDPEKEKLGRIEALFSSPENAVCYLAMLRLIKRQAGQELKALEWEEVRAEIQSSNDQISTWLGQSKTVGASTGLRLLINPLTKHVPPSGATSVGQGVGMTLQNLRQVGKNRKAYIDSTTSWLRRYQNMDSSTLERAWQERPFALEEGVQDDPATIVEWGKENAFKVYIKQKANSEGLLRNGRSVEELLEKYATFIPELSSRYSAETTLEALEKLDKIGSIEADFPAATIKLEDGYEYRIFSKDDPAGFTIGPDTSCCMKLGGQSESCIWAGYQQPQAGFSALYKDNKLIAQSFIWHAEGPDGETLVLDNIEAQRGRSVSDIVGHTQQALTLYLAKLAERNPKTAIKAVNLGSGYLASGLAETLPSAKPVDIPSYAGYSDARNQLELLRLNDALPDKEALEAVVFKSTNSKSKPPDETTEFQALTTDPEAVAMVARLEQQIYPDGLRSGPFALASGLERANNYSFLITSKKGNSGIVGYMIAYRDDEHRAVYVEDLAIAGDAQSQGYGMQAYRYLFDLLEQNGEDAIIFEARENTSYQALRRPSVQDFIEERGFEMVSSRRLPHYYGNGESAYHIRMERKR